MNNPEGVILTEQKPHLARSKYYAHRCLVCLNKFANFLGVLSALNTFRCSANSFVFGVMIRFGFSFLLIGFYG